jgi:hypothetical protein
VLLSNRAKLDSVHAFSTSKLVTMGVTVASLALGGLIQMHKARPQFEAALRSATERLGG